MQFPGPLSDFNVDISNLISKKRGFYSIENEHMSGLKNSVVQLSWTSRFSCHASTCNFSFSLVQQERVKAHYLPIKFKIFKSKVKLGQGREILRAAYPKYKLQFTFV